MIYKKIQKHKKLFVFIAAILLFILSSVNVFADDPPSQIFVEYEHDNTAYEYYDPYTYELVYTEYSWDNTNDHPFVFLLIEAYEHYYMGYVFKYNAFQTGGGYYFTEDYYVIYTTWTGYYNGNLNLIT